MTFEQLQHFTKSLVKLFDFYGYRARIGVPPIGEEPILFENTVLSDFLSELLGAASPNSEWERERKISIAKIMYACISARNCEMPLCVISSDDKAGQPIVDYRPQSLRLLSKLLAARPDLIEYVRDEFRVFGFASIFFRVATCLGRPGIELLKQYMNPRTYKSSLNEAAGMNRLPLLACICLEQNSELALYLVQEGSDPFIRNGKKRNPLIYAIQYGLTAVVRAIVIQYGYEQCRFHADGSFEKWVFYNDQEMINGLALLRKEYAPVKPVLMSATPPLSASEAAGSNPELNEKLLAGSDALKL